MTEDEAHMKTCCGPEGCGRFNETPFPARWCVGSDCMAWRQGKPMTRTESRGPEGGYRKVEIANGFCGLAGSPNP